MYYAKLKILHGFFTLDIRRHNVFVQYLKTSQIILSSKIWHLLCYTYYSTTILYL